MAHSDVSRRRHRSHRSRSKHYRTAQTSHAHTPEHLGPQICWPTLLTAPDGNKKNLVKEWLDDLEFQRPGTADEEPYHSKRGKSKRFSPSRPGQPSPEPWKPNNLPFLADIGTAGSSPQSRRREHGHKRSRAVIADDSSIIVRDDARGLATTLAASSRSHRPTPAVEEGSYFGRRKKTRRANLEDSVTSRASSAANHVFKKRARYKTRIDRYDIIKHDNGKGKNTKTRSRAESKKSKKRGDHMTSAKEVMDNFSSHSILNDRITVGVTSIPSSC